MIRAFQLFLDKNNIVSSFIDDERTMLRFNVFDINYIFAYDETKDPAYIRFIVPNAGDIDIEDTNSVRMLYKLTTSFKLGKAYEQEGQVWFSTDAFVYTKENIDRVFLRMIVVLRDMLNQYRLGNHGKESL